mgnify:CR=1 FL=1
MLGTPHGEARGAGQGGTQEKAERAGREGTGERKGRAVHHQLHKCSLALGEATAKAVQRIPDAKCNGDMHAAPGLCSESESMNRKIPELPGFTSTLLIGGCGVRKRRVTKNKSKAAILWMWEHTKMIVNCLSVLYVLNWLYSLVVIVVAIKETGQFSYLDTLISETNETFRIVVGANIVKAGVENIFKYNDFGGKGSRYMGTSNSENENIENVEDNRG